MRHEARADRQRLRLLGRQPRRPVRLAETGQLDYLTLEYLAELTMSILARAEAEATPTPAYATDFLDVLERLAPILQDQPRLKIVTNAGGMNPHGCAAKARERPDEGRPRPSARIGVVSGDDLLPRLDELLAAGHTLNHLDTGEPLASIRDRVVSANAYLGARADRRGAEARARRSSSPAASRTRR